MKPGKINHKRKPQTSKKWTCTFLLILYKVFSKLIFFCKNRTVNDYSSLRLYTNKVGEQMIKDVKKK